MKHLERVHPSFADPVAVQREFQNPHEDVILNVAVLQAE